MENTSDIWLSERTVAAYEHVLMNDAWTPASLADVLGVPEAEVGQVLDDLVAGGLIRSSQEDDLEMAPVAPAVGLRPAVDRAEQELHEHIAEVERMRTRVTDLMESFEEHRRRQRSNTFEILRGRDAAVRRIAELAGEATEEIGSVVSSPPSEQALQQARAGDLAVWDRGVRTRGLFLEGHRRQSPALREYLQWTSAHGGEVRIAPVLPSRMMFFDRHTAVLSLDPGSAAAGALVVHTPGLVEVVVALFDQLWTQSAELAGAPTGTPAPAFSELERTVLRLLAQGHKDEAVSRRTGLSLRSVRRVISGIGDRLGTQSRFELGVRCRDLDLL